MNDKYDHSISVDVGKVDKMASELAASRLSDADFLRHIAGHFADHHGDRLREIADLLGGWQPIETAPKSSRVLIRGGARNVVDGYHDVQAAWIDGLGNVWADDRKEGSAPVRPTHWMPLTEPR